jgi:hypothetical protein
MKLTCIAGVALLSASLSTTAFAQPAPQSTFAGMGSGAGMGPSAGQNSGVARFAWNKDNTTGWTLMTAEERKANQAKMRAVTSYEECKLLQEENHKTMESRAKENGVTLSATRLNGCNVMKARGFIK